MCVRRLWLVPRPEGKGKKQTILFKDFEPDTDDNFATLLDKVNSDIDRREIQGTSVTGASYKGRANNNCQMTNAIA